MYCSYRGGFAPRISTVQNTQAPSEFLTTSIPKQKPWMLSILQKLKVDKFFALELKLSKTLSGLVYFVPLLYEGRSPPYNCNTKYSSPLRVFDNFNSKAKTLDAVNFAKIKNSKLKASRSPLTQSRVLLKENTVTNIDSI